MKTIRCPLTQSKAKRPVAAVALLKSAAAGVTSFALGLSIVMSLGSSLIVRTEPQQIALKAERPAEIRRAHVVVREIASVPVKAVKESPSLSAKLAN